MRYSGCRIPPPFSSLTARKPYPILNMKRSVPSSVASSDDEETDYNAKLEFYDPKIDEKDEAWVGKQKGGNRRSDAVLSCPSCFTTLCLQSQRFEAKFAGLWQFRTSQMEISSELSLRIRRNRECRFVTAERHETNVTQYRAIFVVNCKVISSNDMQLDQPSDDIASHSSSCNTNSVGGATSREAAGSSSISCSVCSAQVGVLDDEQVYHFFDVIPSES